MKEVEVKARVDDLKDVKTKLVRQGCSFSDSKIQNDRVFKHKSQDITNKTKGTVLLRIRTTKDSKILTLKKMQENELDNIEKELEIDNPKTMAEIIELLDYEEYVQINKTRREAKLNDMTICLDDVSGLGTFIELEKITEEDSLKVQEELIDFLEEIGIPKDNLVTKGYDSLMYAKNR